MNCKAIYRNFFVVVCVLVFFVVLPILIWEMHVNDYQTHVIAWFVSGTFVMLTLPISLLGVITHLNHYTNPDVQRYVIRIIFMAPIYAIDCWLALRFKDMAIYIDTLRELYEAFVIYSFAFLLMRVLAPSDVELYRKLEHKEPMHHIFPFCWLKPWPMPRKFIKKCKNGVLFYALARTITSLLAFVMQLAGVYKAGEFTPAGGYFWVTLVNNFTQIWAMYCLIQFYHVNHKELTPFKPFPKFLCIKLVVFFSFWQGVGIAILVFAGVIKQDADWTSYDIDDVANGLQNFIICIEMFIAAIAHLYAFPYEDFVLEDEAEEGDSVDSTPRMHHHLTWKQKIKEVFDVSDISADMYEHIQDVGKGTKRKTRALARKLKPGNSTATVTPAAGQLQEETAGTSHISYGTSEDPIEVQEI